MIGLDVDAINEVMRERAAEARWRRHNAEARLKPCHCGRPSTDVRYFGGNVGRVPVESWTCAEHVDVNSWSRTGDGPWEPSWMHPEPCPLGQQNGMMRPRVGPVTYSCPHRTH